MILTGLVFTSRIGVSVKQQFTEEEIYKDRDSQITAIEKTFEDAQKSVIKGLAQEAGGGGEADRCDSSPSSFSSPHLCFLPSHPPDLPTLQQAPGDTRGGHACLPRL